MKAEDLHDISRIFAEDIKRYLDAGGDRNNLKASHVYEFLYYKSLEEKQRKKKESTSIRTYLGVRSDKKNESRV